MIHEEGQGGEGPDEVTLLLRRWQQMGDTGALDAAFEKLYPEMQRAAEVCLRRRTPEGMQAAALVHEAYLRLTGERALPEIRDGRHFLALGAKMMRRILVDLVREHGAVKRGGRHLMLPLDDRLQSGTADMERAVALSGALERLMLVRPDWAEVIDLRYFAGFELRETCEILGVSQATVVRRQRAAELWLARAIAGRWR